MRSGMEEWSRGEGGVEWRSGPPAFAPEEEQQGDRSSIPQEEDHSSIPLLRFRSTPPSRSSSIPLLLHSAPSPHLALLLLLLPPNGAGQGGDGEGGGGGGARGGGVKGEG